MVMITRHCECTYCPRTSHLQITKMMTNYECPTTIRPPIRVKPGSHRIGKEKEKESRVIKVAGPQGCVVDEAVRLHKDHRR